MTAHDSRNEALCFDAVSLKRGERMVLADLSFAVQEGELVAVLGPSGAGKSSLLAAATGVLETTSGTIRVLGQTLPLARAPLFALRRKIGFLLQGNGLLTDLNVAENVALPLQMHTELDAEAIRALVAQKLAAVGLAEAAELSPQQLSGGMMRRVALARALALDPPLLLYDEPFTGLDPITKGVIVKLISDLCRQLGLTSIVVSHDVAECLMIADRVLVVANGGLVFSGTPATLRATSDPLLRQFLEGSHDGPISFEYRRQGARAHA